MSYEKMMKWNKKRPKGTKQPILMHTNSGFTPSTAFLEDYFEYRAESEAIGIEPISCEEYYKTPSFLKRELLTPLN